MFYKIFRLLSQFQFQSNSNRLDISQIVEEEQCPPPSLPGGTVTRVQGTSADSWATQGAPDMTLQVIVQMKTTTSLILVRYMSCNSPKLSQAHKQWQSNS